MSGSAISARCSAASGFPRTRFQSVWPVVGETLPIASSFRWFGPPGRDQSANILTLVHVNDRNLDVIYQANGIDAIFTIVEPVIHAFQCRAIENPGGLGELNAVPADVDGVLRGIELEVHLFSVDAKNLACKTAL